MIGCLMIGGRSRRMGTPKSLILRGKITISLYLSRLMEDLLGTPPVLSGDGPADNALMGNRKIADRENGVGPLSGLLGLTEAFPDQDLLVLATDMFAMNREALEWLISEASGTNRLFIWPRFSTRSCGEPLAAIYRSGCSPTLEAAWQRGIRGPVGAVPEKARHQPLIPPHLEQAFASANRPEELETLQQRLCETQ